MTDLVEMLTFLEDSKEDSLIKQDASRHIENISFYLEKLFCIQNKESVKVKALINKNYELEIKLINDKTIYLYLIFNRINSITSSFYLLYDKKKPFFEKKPSLLQFNSLKFKNKNNRSLVDALLTRAILDIKNFIYGKEKLYISDTKYNFYYLEKWAEDHNAIFSMSIESRGIINFNIMLKYNIRESFRKLGFRSPITRIILSLKDETSHIETNYGFQREFFKSELNSALEKNIEYINNEMLQDFEKPYYPISLNKNQYTLESLNTKTKLNINSLHYFNNKNNFKTEELREYRNNILETKNLLKRYSKLLIDSQFPDILKSQIRDNLRSFEKIYNNSFKSYQKAKTEYMNNLEKEFEV